MPEMKDGCVKPARGPILPVSDSASPGGETQRTQEVELMLASVGKSAIDFEATAYVEGVGFKPITLSDYKGQWVVICFYPGDFTFV